MTMKHLIPIAALAVASCNIPVPAHAQDLQAISEQALNKACAVPVLTGPRAIICGSPRLRAGHVRNVALMLHSSARLPPQLQPQLTDALNSDAQRGYAYCHADAPNPQLPPSPAMETCMVYWQDTNFTNLQYIDQLVDRISAEANANRAAADFVQGLAAVLGAAAQVAGAVAGAAVEYGAVVHSMQPARPTTTYCTRYASNQWTANYSCW